MVNHLKIGKFERRPVIKRNLIRICIASVRLVEHCISLILFLENVILYICLIFLVISLYGSFFLH